MSVLTGFYCVKTISLVADSRQRYFTKNPNSANREGALIQPNHIKHLYRVVQTEYKTEVSSISTLQDYSSNSRKSSTRCLKTARRFSNAPQSSNFSGRTRAITFPKTLSRMARPVEAIKDRSQVYRLWNRVARKKTENLRFILVTKKNAQHQQKSK